MVVWEHEFQALWHMCAGTRTTELEKKRAYQIGAAFFTELFLPLVSEPATEAFIKRSSATQRAKWFGLVFNHLGYRREGEEGYDETKNVDDLPKVDTAANTSNWR